MVWSPTPSKTRPGATSIILVQSQVLQPGRSHILWSNPIRDVSWCLLDYPHPTQGPVSNEDPRFGVDPIRAVSRSPLYCPHHDSRSCTHQGATFWGQTHWRCVLVSSHPSSSSSRFWYPPRSHVLGSNPLEMPPGVLPPIFIQLQVLVRSHVLGSNPLEMPPGVLPPIFLQLQVLVRSHVLGSNPLEMCPGVLPPIFIQVLVRSHVLGSNPLEMPPGVLPPIFLQLQVLVRSHVLGSNPLEMRPGVLPPIFLQLQLLVSTKEPRFGVEPTGDASWCPPTHLPPAPGSGEEPRFGVEPTGDASWCPPNHLHPAPGSGIHQGATFWGQSHWRCVLVPSHPSSSSSRFWYPPRSHVLGSIPLEMRPGVLPPISIQLQVLESTKEPRFGVNPTTPVTSQPRRPPPSRRSHPTRHRFFRSRAEDAGTVAGLEEKAEEAVSSSGPG
ncbi:uncharacterized protein ACIBXB_002807 isoform 5-T13 [Morphnus guianensis]